MSEKHEGQGEEEKSAGVIAPPPLIYFVFLVLGYCAHRAMPGPGFPLSHDLRAGLSGLCVLAGLVIALLGMAEFAKAKTPVEPWKAAQAVVDTGIYQFTRNPMYLGMALLFTGACLLLDAPIALIALVPALIVMEWGVIRREERYLEAKFGERYRHYKAAVRRWI